MKKKVREWQSKSKLFILYLFWNWGKTSIIKTIKTLSPAAKSLMLKFFFPLLNFCSCLCADNNNKKIIKKNLCLCKCILQSCEFGTLGHRVTYSKSKCLRQHSNRRNNHFELHHWTSGFRCLHVYMFKYLSVCCYILAFSQCNRINGWLRQKSIFILKNKWEETNLMVCTLSLCPHPWGIISPNPCLRCLSGVYFCRLLLWIHL